MRIAVIGYGYWGRNLAREFDSLGALYAVCDTDAKALKQAELSYPAAKITVYPQEVMRDPAVDGTVIATPSALHYTLAEQSVRAGKDVFVEKPFTTNTADAVRLESLSVSGGQVLMVGYLMLYHPAIQQLRSYVRSGELGDIYYTYSTRVNLGQVRQDEDVLWRLASHDASMLLYLLGAEYSVLSAHGFSYIRPRANDVVFALLQFGGTVAHIQVSWLDPHKVRRLTVVGSKKMAVFDDTTGTNKLRVFDKGINRADLSVRSGGATLSPPSNPNILGAECAAFIEAMRTREQPLSNVKVGVEVTKMLESIDRRMRTEDK